MRPPVPASMRPEPFDAELRAMQIRWHELRQLWLDEGFPDVSQHRRAFDHHDKKLTDYLWAKTQHAIAEDRRKHPKAKRNAPVPARDPATPSTRYLP